MSSSLEILLAKPYYQVFGSILPFLSPSPTNLHCYATYDRFAPRHPFRLLLGPVPTSLWIYILPHGATPRSSYAIARSAPSTQACGLCSCLHPPRTIAKCGSRPFSCRITPLRKWRGLSLITVRFLHSVYPYNQQIHRPYFVFDPLLLSVSPIFQMSMSDYWHLDMTSSWSLPQIL